MNIIGIIPARYGSTRFPGKMLTKISGKSLIQRVWERCSLAPLEGLYIATDHEAIQTHAEQFGAQVIMTSIEHPSGTDRCFEALGKIGGKVDYVINIQGDEPYIDPMQIKALAEILDGKTELATLIKSAKKIDEVLDQASAKVVINKDQEAIYFSRSPIPFVRGQAVEQWLSHADFYIHVGLYAYRADILKAISHIPEGKLELAEKLEQLRWLESGYRIKTVLTDGASLSVDRPEDVAKAEDFAAKWGL